MTLSEIKHVLGSEGIRLTKSLGQNFLHDRNQLRRIVEASGLGKTDRVLEIGPGLGPLTELLVARAGEVLAIEKDRRLCALLRHRFASAANLTLIEADALDYFRGRPADWTGWKLVANLPYSVASPILVELALSPGPPRLIVVTLQLEVAQRLTANAGAADYGVLTLLVQSRYVPRRFFKIPASCFFPEPEVDSACIVLDCRARDLLPPEAVPVFTGLVKRSFSQRRKMMLKLLKQDWPPARLFAAFRQAGLSEQTRAENVTIEQFAQLARALHGANGARHSEPAP